MSAPLMHIESSPSLPQEADVVVIGGGVVGVFTATILPAAALRSPCSKRAVSPPSSPVATGDGAANRTATRASYRSRPRALDLWERVAQETGEDTGFRRCGLLYLVERRQ